MNLKELSPAGKIQMALALILCIGLLFLMWQILVPTNSEEKILRIRSGDTAQTIATKLSELGLIRSEYLFVQLAKLTKNDRQLQTGTYVIGGHLNLWQVVNNLKDGKQENIRLTFQEGLSLFRSAQVVQNSGIKSSEQYMEAAVDTAFVRKLTGFQVKSLEGFLYPETYLVDIDTPADSILGIQTREFFKRLKAANIEITDKEEFYKVLILASIVEKEAIQQDEKPIVAGVYLNRVAEGMRLESCPTVDYILEKRGIKRSVLTRQDTEIYSPYNTYQVDGLPPTPICNPTISSIQAVLNPAKHRYFFFFADRQGRNVFSRSFDEHLNKQRNYR